MARRPARVAAAAAAAVAALAALLALRDCGRGGGGAATAGAGAGAAGAGAAAAGTAGTGAGTLAVTSLTLGKAVGPDKRVAAEVDRFGKDDTIYAVVGTRGTASGANLTARWTWFSHGSGHPISADTLVVSPNGEARTVFLIQARRDGWAAGDYKVAIELEGKEVSSRTFEVVR